MKVLILTENFGEGHNSAGYALIDELISRNIFVEMVDLDKFTNKSNSNEKLTYNYIVKKAPRLVGIINSIGVLFSKIKSKSPIYYSNLKKADKLYNYILKNNYDLIICVHIFAMHTLSEVKKKINNILTYGVFTDYAYLTLAEESNLDGYFVANSQIKEECIKNGMKEDKIFITGIPVQEKFNFNISKKEAREYLGVEENIKMFFIMAGGIGGGNIKGLIDNFIKRKENFVVYVIFGNNIELKNKLEEKYKSDKRVIAVGFSKDIHYYLRACDVFLSKAGGISSSEAAVVGVPLIHTISLPGWEMKNIKYFNKNGMNIYAKKPKNAIKKAFELFEDKEKQKEIISNQKEKINSKATKDIIDKILNDYNELN